MKKKAKNIRLDEVLLQRGLADSVEAALPLIMAGSVLVNGQVQYKASFPVKSSDRVDLKEKNPYVSRGGLKIKRAFESFAIEIEGKSALDIGISTGGFSDYLLQNGAAEVLGVDVNTDQVDFQLRKDPRLRLLKKNARELQAEDIPFAPDLIVMDLSFISITKIFPLLKMFDGARIVCLVKPQFEAPKHKVAKGGIVSSESDRIDIVLSVKERIEACGFGITDFSRAGVRGQKGNQEYFFLAEYGKNSMNDDRILAEIKDV